MYHPNELDQQIENLRTLQESYNVLAENADVYNKGKAQIAASVSSKGVPADNTDSLQTLATKVIQIPQQINTRTSDFEQMIAPTPYIWNVYSVATDLMKVTLPDYLPAYMSEYKQRYGTNSFFVGEYYRGYASLELTGADGYLTHDGCFYTIAEGVVTRTAPDGTVTTYEASSIVHTWLNDTNDTYMNRWVAFFYLTDAYGFTNTNSAICPRRVALCGTCNSFVISGENRITDVWVIGTLGLITGGTNGEAWSQSQVIQHYETHTGDAIYVNRNFLSLIMPDLKILRGRLFSIPTSYGQNYFANYILLPELTTISDKVLVIYSVSSGSNPNYISLPKLVSLNVPIISSNQQSNGGANGALTLELQALEVLNITSNGDAYGSARGLLSAYVDCLKGEIIIRLPSLKKITAGWILHEYGGYTNNFTNVKDIEVGAMETNLNLKSWRYAPVAGDARTQLVENIKNHILAKVSDRTGLSQLTFTVSTAMYNAVSGESIEWQGETMTLADAFLTKNWLLAGA